MQKGFTLWLTGLSGSGKTTLANLLEKSMQQRGLKVELLDGDVLRKNLNPDLGFSPGDRFINIQRAAFLAKLLNRHDVIVIASLITPYSEMRAYCRREIGDYVEVYIKCPLAVLINRDTKGLYKKALEGQITNFTGISDPYEEPSNPQLIIESDKEAPAESAAKIMTWLEQTGYIPHNRTDVF